jgi:hypothetical protein
MQVPSSVLKSCILSAVLGLTLSIVAGPGQAQEFDEEAEEHDRVMTADEIAKELSNPVTALRSIFNDFEYRTFDGELPGSGDQTSWIYLLTPSIPFKLANGKNILLRATIPFYLNQPVWETWVGHPIWEVDRSYADWLLRQSPQVTDDSGRFFRGHDHLADVTFDAAYGGVSDGGFISMFGIAGVLPSSQDVSASRDQFLLGPEVVLGKSADWGVIGAWATHLMRVSGENSFDTNETTIKLFFAYGLGNGWQIISNPTILYDWEADSGNELLLPIGGGVSKTAWFGHKPVKFEMELQKYIETPDRFGPEWLFTFSITPVVSHLYRK